MQPTLTDSGDCLLCERCSCARSRDTQGAPSSHFRTSSFITTAVTIQRFVGCVGRANPRHWFYQGFHFAMHLFADCWKWAFSWRVWFEIKALLVGWTHWVLYSGVQLNKVDVYRCGKHGVHGDRVLREEWVWRDASFGTPRQFPVYLCFHFWNLTDRKYLVDFVDTFQF